MEIVSVEYKRNGIILRKVCLSAEGKQYVVFDQTAILSHIKTGVVIKWRNEYVIDCPNRDYARTSYVGRTVMAAYEEGNIDILQIER